MLAVIEKDIHNIETQAENRGKQKWKREGKREGRCTVNRIYASLFKQGRAADVQQAVDDPEYLKKIMEEFGYHDDDDEEDDIV